MFTLVFSLTTKTSSELELPLWYLHSFGKLKANGPFLKIIDLNAPYKHKGGSREEERRAYPRLSGYDFAIGGQVFHRLFHLREHLPLRLGLAGIPGITVIDDEIQKKKEAI
jgi:hypothetical protein